MAITGELANIVVNTNYNDIPKEAIEDTNDLVIDFVGD
jgi:2-methylcitrate dehydratase PrpD